ncbi:MAG: hypothetical protein Q8M16_13265 [Pirellulaceae bacterium]|nr:hypothetical protein [Pirellulaceae bacterium]
MTSEMSCRALIAFASCLVVCVPSATLVHAQLEQLENQVQEWIAGMDE